jgi:hypothetical protein
MEVVGFFRAVSNPDYFLSVWKEKAPMRLGLK